MALALKIVNLPLSRVIFRYSLVDLGTKSVRNCIRSVAQHAVRLSWCVILDILEKSYLRDAMSTAVQS